MHEYKISLRVACVCVVAIDDRKQLCNDTEVGQKLQGLCNDEIQEVLLRLSDL
jgi:hypothetical protein